MHKEIDATVLIKEGHHSDEGFEREVFSKTLLGFWLYILSDCILFGALFATYFVLYKNVFGGPGAGDLFDPSFALKETLILLTSSFTCGLADLSARRTSKKGVLLWFGATFLLGAAFLGMELTEFSQLLKEGYSWKTSAFLSSFFTLVGTHGAHITAGLLWICVMAAQIARRGLTGAITRRLRCLSIFWHFLDVVWIFIFTTVYLMGAA
jgi:cytochrome o ubiquinol oxidase subunit 3